VSGATTRWTAPDDATKMAPPGAPMDPGPTSINRGDLFWLEPDPDEARGSVPGYAHPHLVVQDDVFNHSRIHTVVVCALTSNLLRASEPGNVLLDAGEGDLPKQSVVVVSQVSSVDKARLGARIGALSDARVEQVLAGMRFQQASFFRR
jgi:mRNA interferase MazF